MITNTERLSRHKLYIPFIIVCVLFSFILALEYHFLQTLISRNTQADVRSNFALMQNICANMSEYMEDSDSPCFTSDSLENRLFYLPDSTFIEVCIIPDNYVSLDILEFYNSPEVLTERSRNTGNIIYSFFSKKPSNSSFSAMSILPLNQVNKDLSKMAYALIIALIVVLMMSVIPALLLIESHYRKLAVIKSLTFKETSSFDRVFFEGVLNSSRIGGMILAPDGSILLLNEYCRKLLEVGDINQQTLFLSSLIVLPESIRQIKLASITLVTKQNITISLMDGSIVECFLEIFPCKRENKLTSLLFLFSPVSLFSSNLSVNEKSDSSLSQNLSTMKNQLNRAIMHKINNHLSGMIGFISVEIEKLGESKAQASLKSILKSSEKISELCTELQKALKPDDRNLIINPVEELDRISSILKNVLPSTVSVEIGGISLRGIKVTRGEFREFFYSLALNSTEMMNGEGRIRIEVSEKMPVFNRSVDSFPVGKKVCIRYSDGYIMPVALRDVFLNRNYSSADVERLFGSTIGNIYKAISNNLGDIVFERGSGETVLCLLLDSYQLGMGKTHTSKMVLPARTISDFKVIIADEVSLLVDSAAEYLEINGMLPVKANSGVAVRELIARDNFDAIVIGLNMGRPSTRNLVRFCQNSKPDMKIVITTGYDFPQEIEEFVKNPFTCYLHKPYKPSDLLMKLDFLFSKGMSNTRVENT